MKIDHLKVFSSHAVVFGRKGGLTHVEVLPLKTAAPTAATEVLDNSIIHLLVL
jgi:UDP-glucose 4-epimerase